MQSWSSSDGKRTARNIAQVGMDGKSISDNILGPALVVFSNTNVPCPIFFWILDFSPKISWKFRYFFFWNKTSLPLFPETVERCFIHEIVVFHTIIEKKRGSERGE